MSPYAHWEIASLTNEEKTTLNSSSPGDPIYPTPLLGQDMTQGQFLSGV